MRFLGYYRLSTLLVIFALLFVFAVQAQAQGEKKIPVKELPAPVWSAFQKAYPHAQAKAASKETEHGVTYYEIESVDGTTHRDLLYTKDGQVTEVEESIEPSSLPREVKDAVEKSYPKCTITRAETSTHESTTHYELVIQSGKSKHEVVLDKNGKITEDKTLGTKKKGESAD